jgi:hypothetical protein
MTEYQHSIRLSKILALAILFCPLFLGAAQEASGLQMRLSIPWTQIQKMIQTEVRNSGAFVKSMTDSSLQVGEIRAFVATGKVDFAGLQKITSQVGESRFDFGVEGSRLRIQVPTFKIDQEIERAVAGGVLRVRIQATCGPLVLSQAFKNVAGRYRFGLQDLKIVGAFESFQVEPDAAQFQMQDLVCQGAPGLDAYLQKRILDLVRSPAFLSLKVREFVEPFLQRELNEKVQLLISGLQVPGSALGSQSRLVLKSVEQTELGLRASLDWIFDERSNNLLAAPDRPRDNTDFGSRMGLQISKDGFELLLRRYLQQQPEWTTLKANDFADFQKLLFWRFAQFFVWPDLFNFPKKATFPLLIQKPEIQAVHFRGTSLKLKAKTTAWLQAPRDGKIWYYVALMARVNGEFEPMISNGQLKLQARAVTSQSKIGFGQDYVNRFGPNQYIASSVTEPLVDNLLKERAWSFALPQVKLSSNLTVKVQSYRLQNETLHLLLAP